MLCSLQHPIPHEHLEKRYPHSSKTTSWAKWQGTSDSSGLFRQYRVLLLSWPIVPNVFPLQSGILLTQ